MNSPAKPSLRRRRISRNSTRSYIRCAGSGKPFVVTMIYPHYYLLAPPLSTLTNLLRGYRQPLECLAYFSARVTCSGLPPLHSDKLNVLSTEIETIEKQLEQYQGLKDSKVMIFDEMRRMIDTVVTFSKLLSGHPNNFDIQHQLLIANIDRIRCEEETYSKLSIDGVRNFVKIGTAHSSGIRRRKNRTATSMTRRNTPRWKPLCRCCVSSRTD